MISDDECVTEKKPVKNIEIYDDTPGSIDKFEKQTEWEPKWPDDEPCFNRTIEYFSSQDCPSSSYKTNMLNGDGSYIFIFHFLIIFFLNIPFYRYNQLFFRIEFL